MRRRVSQYVFIIICLLFLLCPVLRAQGVSDKEAAKDLAVEKVKDRVLDDNAYRQKLSEIISKQEEGEEYKSEVDAYMRYMPMSSLRDQPGKISVIHSAAEYNYLFKAFKKIPVQVGFGAGYINLNKNEAVPVSLPTKLTGFSFGAQATFPCFNVDNAYLRFGVTPSFEGEDWQIRSSNFSIPMLALAIYQPMEKLTLVGGFLFTPGTEDSFVGIGGLIYTPTDKLSFNLIPPRPTITYQLTKIISLFLEGNLFNNEYKVSKDGIKGKSLTYNEWDVGGGINLTVNKSIDISLSAGNMFNRYLKYSDSLGKVDIKNGPYMQCRVEITF